MALALIIENDFVALSADETGTVRVGGTRVTLDSLVWAFEEGASAEEIVSTYPSLQLADVYSAIGYYLKHRDEIQAYLKQREEEAEELRRKVEARWPSNGLRERLLARRAERDQATDS
jgi:uncharacterized protein (DUF433 family)